MNIVDVMISFANKHKILAAIIVLWIVGVFGQATGILKQPVVETTTYEELLTIEGEPECIVGDYTTHISGVVRNNRKYAYNTVTISFSIYDSQGNKIGTATDTISHLGPNETWKFEAIAFCSDSKVEWRLDSLKGR